MCSLQIDLQSKRRQRTGAIVRDYSYTLIRRPSPVELSRSLSVLQCRTAGRIGCGFGRSLPIVRSLAERFV